MFCFKYRMYWKKKAEADITDFSWKIYFEKFIQTTWLFNLCGFNVKKTSMQHIFRMLSCELLLWWSRDSSPECFYKKNKQASSSEKNDRNVPDEQWRRSQIKQDCSSMTEFWLVFVVVVGLCRTIRSSYYFWLVVQSQLVQHSLWLISPVLEWQSLLHLV